MKIEIVKSPAFDKQMCNIGSHHWSVPRLAMLASELEVMDIPLAHLDMWVNYKNITLRELAGHIKATNEADMTKPIILDEDGSLMDGRHRIMRALIEEHDFIKAVRFSTNPSPCKIDDD